jgi:hypothetical protein
VHTPRQVKSVTIQINDLFEFEGQPVPAQRPDNALVEAMTRRQFEFLRQPLQIEIGESTVTVSFSEESLNTQDEAGRLAERAAKRAGEGTNKVVVQVGPLGQPLLSEASLPAVGLNRVAEGLSVM